MAVTNTQVYPSNSTAALLQAWAGALSNGLASLGLVRTADTGQTLGSALAVSATNGALLGYEIFRFNDTLQATSPLYLRVEYRNMSSGTTMPQVKVQVGAGTDGAGNLTGPAPHLNTVTASFTVLYDNAGYPFNGPTTQTQLLTVSGDASSVAVLFFPNTGTNAGGGFLVERSRDADGTPNGRGFIFLVWSSASPAGTQSLENRIFNFYGAQPSSLTTAITPYAPQYSTVLDQGVVYPLPVHTGYTPRLNAPSKWITVAGKTDLPFGTTYTMSLYGESGTWISLGGGTASGSTTVGWGSWTSNAFINSPQVRIA